MTPEKIPILVCGEQTYFEDDVADICLLCKRRIWHRPYVSHIHCKVCGTCGRRLMYAHGVPENVEIPRQALAEILTKITAYS